jgi:hypothetical protein
VEVEQVTFDDFGAGRGERLGALVKSVDEGAHAVAASSRILAVGAPVLPVAAVIRNSGTVAMVSSPWNLLC